MDVFKHPEGRPLSAGRFNNQIRYELATHTVKVRRTGVLSDVVKLWDLQGTYILLLQEGIKSCVRHYALL